MPHCLILILFLFLTTISLQACDSSGQSVPKIERNPNKVIELRPVPTRLLSNAERKVEVVQTTTTGGKELDQVQFVDPDNGWAGNRRVLYRTSDAGKTWQPLRPKLDSEAYITSFFFINKLQGWLTVVSQKQGESYGLGKSSTIVVTHDGGTTWSQQANFADEVNLQNVAFLDESNGIAVGGKVLEQTLSRGETFVVRTSDGGRTWNDLSEQVKAGIGQPVGHYRVKTRWVSPSHVYMLTLNGRLMASETGGDKWKMIADFNDIRPDGFASSTGFYKLLFSPQGRMAILAGAAGDEGYWGDLVIPNDRDSWTSYELIRMPLDDALFLSEDQILACGKELYLRDEKSNIMPSPQGVILYSDDRGKTWSVVHHTGSDESLISLTKINEKEFYAISDSGKFIKFKLN